MLGRDAGAPVMIEAPAEQAHYPPGYPGILALVSLGGADPLDAARWVAAALMALNCLAAAELVRPGTGCRVAAIFVAGAIALTPASVRLHAWALSEPLYVFFSLLAFGLLISHLRRRSFGKLIGAALLVGAAMLTRYAGAALIPAGILILFLLESGDRKRRMIDASIFGAIAALLPVGWYVRNQIVLGSAMNRVLAFHPVTVSHLIDVAKVCWMWLGADEPRHVVLTFLAALIVLVVLIAALRLAWKRRDGAGDLAGAMLIYIAAFGAVLVGSISFVDASTPVDDRVLSPVYVAWLILIGCLIARRADISGRARVVAACLGAALCIWAAVRSEMLVHQLWREGGGFAQRSWRESSIIATVKTLPADKIVYTNAPGAVYLLTGRPMIVTVPGEFSASSRLANPEYADLMGRMRDDLHGGRAVLVYLGRYAKSRWYYPSDAELRKKLGLHPLMRHKEDVIYDYVAPASSTAPTTAQ